jgi:hypothetical protein
MASSTSLERLARMEVEVTELRKSLDEHKDQTKKNFDAITEKLDTLLALRNKGAGVFWVLSTVFTGGVITGLISFFHHLGIK